MQTSCRPVQRSGDHDLVLVDPSDPLAQRGFVVQRVLVAQMDRQGRMVRGVSCRKTTVHVARNGHDRAGAVGLVQSDRGNRALVGHDRSGDPARVVGLCRPTLVHFVTRVASSLGSLPPEIHTQSVYQILETCVMYLSFIVFVLEYDISLSLF